ncbi:DUF7619 domain-containing protein [Flavobacterium sp.]|uniref:DUF7619 domain-containing protein n=1 Tax=Flavobacterium sp. TaxID=239 RepID=UPI002B4B5105|nr:T9SS type A sorting domain-containing protein [Flavobacterium sp.]HLF52446.1 T9SS type A sorting domain-containing protein [Flavobacterium sp.]
MKNILLSFVVFTLTFSVFSQPSCGGQFYDNGGVNGDYLPGSDQVVTICPNNVGDVISVTFTLFNTEAGHDGLYVYNGSTVTANQFVSANPAGNVPGGLSGAFWGTTNPGPFTSSSPDGCLTFRFRSDATTQSLGWIANVTCGPGISTGFHLNAFLDLNGNGNQDSVEYNFPLGQFQYEMNSNGSVGNIISPTGFYDFFEDNPANNYNFSYTIDPVYSAMYSLAVSNYTNVNIGASSGVVSVNFPITSIINYTDLAANVLPLSSPRAGFSYVNRLSYTNFGNQTIANGSLTFTNDPANTIIATSEIVNTTSSGFTYNFSNLSPFETRFIDVTMSVPSIPTVSIGQLLTNSASISTTGTEISLTNNNSSLTQVIVASYDPNDKTESHGEKIVYSTFAPNDYLTYTIRFENTGTAPATNVNVTDVLDPAIAETSIKMISSSNSYVLERVGNNLSWKFDNIQLAVSVSGTNIGKGYITFKAKLKPGFIVGTNVPNMAKIYFDTNPAIDTNIFNTEFVSVLANNSFEFNNLFRISPNPATTTLNINTNQNDRITAISIYNILGQLILVITEPKIEIDITSLKAGNYIIKVKSDKGTSSGKFIKI